MNDQGRVVVGLTRSIPFGRKVRLREIDKLSPNSLRQLRRFTHRAATLLGKQYGAPDLGNLRDPLDETVFIILTSQTNAANFKRTWNSLRTRFPSWEDMAMANTTEIEKAIWSGGLANRKASILKALVSQIKQRTGSLSLDELYSKPDAEVERFLMQLPGIKLKSARCIMLYSFDRQTFPVDANTLRIFKRMDLLPRDFSPRSKKSHDFLQSIVLPTDRKSLHVNLIVHGRRICRPGRPLCEKCVMKRYCTKNL